MYGLEVGLVLTLLVKAIWCQQWMRMALVTSNIYNRKFCDNFNFWTETQRQLCISYGDLIPKVASGAEVAYYECRHQFRWLRWNCTAQTDLKKTSLETTGSNLYPSLFGNRLVLESQEAAFVNALFSAGVAHSITTACSSNQMESCSCDRTSTGFDKDGSKWHRCSDNIEFGVNFAKQFIDSVELNWSLQRMYSSHARNLMNLHNNEVGRRAIVTNMWRKCTCHGVSGSCNTKVCSKEMPAFRFIGNFLKERFDSAIKVKLKYISTHQVLLPANKHSRPVTNLQLVYLNSSPLYCQATKGRRCRNKKDVSGSCKHMCCGRGHRTKERTVIKNCNCKFIWCCKVSCQKCRYKQKIHICK